jgi:hypothetical protein
MRIAERQFWGANLAKRRYRLFGSRFSPCGRNASRFHCVGLMMSEKKGAMADCCCSASTNSESVVGVIWHSDRCGNPMDYHV